MSQRSLRGASFGVLLFLLLPVAAAAWTHDVHTNDLIADAPGATNQTTHILADGAGGYFVVWNARPDTLRFEVQRLDQDGRTVWPQPVPVATFAVYGYTDCRAVVSGGVLYLAIMTTGTEGNEHVRVQAVQADGSLPWGYDGREVTPGYPGYNQMWPSITGDGQGGCIVVWTDYRYGSSDTDIYGQRFSPAGVALWGGSGLSICGAVGVEDTPRVVPAAGGAIVAWIDQRNGGSELYGDRIDLNGASQWLLSGRDLDAPHVVSGSLEAAPDGHDGLLYAWSSDINQADTQGDVYAGRIAGEGEYAITGAVVTADGNQGVVQVLPDNAWGYYVVWTDNRSSDGYDSIVLYAQHVLGYMGGEWGENGIPVALVDVDQYLLSAATDPDGRLALVWHDNRYANTGVFAQVLDPDTGWRWFGSGGQPVSLRGPGLTGNGTMVCDERGGLVTAFTGWTTPSHFQAVAQRLDATGYPGDPRPVLTGAVDAPQDQGGFVLLTWQRSWLDDAAEAGLTGYSVWNRYAGAGKAAGAHVAPGDGQVAALAERSGLPRDAVTALLEAGWTYVGDQPAQEFETYGYTAPTFADSTAEGTPLTEFQVVAVGPSGEIWHSNTMAGYSVDNLAPGAPLALNGELQGVDVALQWSPPAGPVPDLQEYRVYRSATPGVPVDPAHRVGTAPDTLLIDPAPPAGPQYYVVTAVDVHGNEGPVSNEAAVTSVTAVTEAPPRVLTLGEARPNPFNPRTELRLGLPAAQAARVTVYDARGAQVRELWHGTAQAGWRTVTWDGTDGVGRHVPSGLYLVRAVAGDQCRTVKVLLAR